MKLGILSRNRTLYSTKRLIDTARQRRHSVTVLDTWQASQKLRLALPARTAQLPAFEAIIPRIGASVTQRGLQVVRHYESQGTLSLASSDGIGLSRNKWRSLSRLKELNLPVPETVLVSRPGQLAQAIETVNGLPVVLKIAEGTQGHGVILANTLQQAKQALPHLLHFSQQPVLVQEFIAEANNEDIRLIVVGNHCVAGMRRRAPAGDFRANLHQGGTAIPYLPPPEVAQMAIKATKNHHLQLAGVDLIMSKKGPLILEINSSPGLEGIETTTQTDIAIEIIKHLEKQIPLKHPPTK